MFDPIDYSSNQMFKVHEYGNTSPSRFYGLNFGYCSLFIKRTRSNKYSVCGLGCPFVPVKTQRDCDIYSIHDSLDLAVSGFVRLARLLLK